MLDFFFAHAVSGPQKFSAAIYLFFLHQGIEKLCKAYLLAQRESEYEQLQHDGAIQKVEQMAREYSHNIEEMLKQISATLPSVREWLQDNKKDEKIEFLQRMTLAYEGVRYPGQKARELVKEPLDLALMLHRDNQKMAFQIGKLILEGLKTEGILNVKDVEMKIVSADFFLPETSWADFNEQWDAA